MWKKEEAEAQSPKPETEAIMPLERPAAATASGERAVIGRSITIHGEVTGDEDLLIQGRVEGSVHLNQHSITVGPDGEVKASIIGRVITVEGKVEGNLTADEQVMLRGSAWVQGDIAAPRLVLEDGARFRGGVDMGDRADRERRTGGAVPSRLARRRPKPEAQPPETVEVSSENGKSASDTAAEVAK